MSDNQVEKNKKYIEWLDNRYPVKEFTIGNRKFSHALDFYSVKDDGKRTFFFFNEREEELLEYKKKQLRSGGILSDTDEFPIRRRSRFIIDTQEKTFNISLAEEDRAKGLGTMLCYQAPQIMKALGINDAKDYTMEVAGNKNHPFLKRLETKRLVDMTNSKPDYQKAKEILEQLSNYQTPIRLMEYHSLLRYALRSNVPMNEIADAVNKNGFNVSYKISQTVPVFDKEEAEAFRNLKIRGIKPSCLRKHFEGMKGFGVLSLFESADSADSTQEFDKLLSYYKANHTLLPEDVRSLSYLRELDYIFLYVDKSGFLIRNISPKKRKTVRKGAIALFERMDPKHKDEWNYRLDEKSKKIVMVLRDANLLDSNTYIELFQRALNRNYSLDIFQRVINRYVSDSTIRQASEEIRKNVYCPTPRKGIWQKSKSIDACCKPQNILIPSNIINGMDNEGIKRSLIDAIKEGIPPEMKSIKTTMYYRKGGRIIGITDLVSWMRGVDGWNGYLSIADIAGKKYASFPPQTPEKVLEVVNQAFKIMHDPDYGTRF